MLMLIYLLSTKDTGRSASYHEIDSEDRLRTKLYDKFSHSELSIDM